MRVPHAGLGESIALRIVTFGNNLTISLDVAKGKDKCYDVTYCITKGCNIIKTDTISLKEEK